jgi:thiamine-phosphate pyrophosphorylase
MFDSKDLKVYLCTDRLLAKGRPISAAVEAALKGGATMIQVREKEASTREFYDIALEVQRLTRRYQVPLVVNDRLDIALAIHADGLHIGQDDLPLAEARRIAGSSMFIGVSASTVEEARAAEAGGADYLGVGAVYPTGSKADAGAAIGLDQLARVAASVKIPVVGIGGVNAANAPLVLERGAAGVSVISAILSQPDIEEAARVLRKAVDSARP